MENQSTFDSFELQLTEESKSFLKEAGKWAYFLSIVGFVMIGFMVIGAFTLASVFSSFGGGAAAIPGGMITFIYLLLAALYFFPVYFLFKFATNIKLAFANNDTTALTESLRYLKSNFKFVGILTIVLISFYILVILIAIIGGLSSMA